MSAWGKLASRFEGKENEKHKILALDGGGDPADERKAFVFVDGGLTPYNNPAYLLYRIATEQSYRLNWASGEDKLLVVPIGTGAAAAVEGEVDDPNRGLIENVAALPSTLMYAAMIDQDTSCRSVGRCVHGAVLDRENRRGMDPILIFEMDRIYRIKLD